MIIVKPKTVIGWCNQGFRALWRRKSKPGRPRIPKEHIKYIKRISSDHPEWGEDKIAEELAAKFGVNHSGSTQTPCFGFSRITAVHRGKRTAKGQRVGGGESSVLTEAVSPVKGEPDG